MGVEREAAHDERIVTNPLHRFFGGLLHLPRPHRAVLRAERHGHSLRIAVLLVLSNGLDPLPGVRLEPLELDPLTLCGTLHAGFPQILQDHGLKLGASETSFTLTFGLRALVIGREHAMRGKTLDRERARDTDSSVVIIRTVAEQLSLRVACDRPLDRVP